MNDFEDIEQMLKPQCEFKASENLKQEVMEKVRQEVSPRRIIRMWPWLVAACIIGFVIMILMPPKSKTAEHPIVAKAETPKVVEERPVESMPEPIKINIETPQQPKIRRTRPAVKDEYKEEPVEMSEETRKALLLARLETDMPQMETIDPEEEIRQIRMRGERLISMYEENDK